MDSKGLYDAVNTANIYERTVKAVQDDHSWDHSKVVILGMWSSYKIPL